MTLDATAAAAVTAVIVIGGPTAGGKSALALVLAEAFDGVVINADSMQVYAELDILTARPSPEDQIRAPHRLYGVLPATERCSAARWRALALAEIDAARTAGRLPVVVGGTGLYLRALLEGLAEVPTIPEDVRQAARTEHDRLGGPAFHAALAHRDPDSARLKPGDSQRLIRAWEVLTATGRPLSAWQRAAPASAPPPGLRFLPVAVLPPRPALYAACDGRFQSMVERGALAEARALDALGLAADRPALKALGVPELCRHLHGDMALADAVALAQQSTRRYAKRQVTWFRHQFAARYPETQEIQALDNPAAPEQFLESLRPKIFSIIRKSG